MGRIVILLALAFVANMVPGALPAAANPAGQCTQDAPCSRSAALAMCNASGPSAIAVDPKRRQNPVCVLYENSKMFNGLYDYRYEEWREWMPRYGLYGRWFYTEQDSCSTKPPYIGPPPMSTNQAVPRQSSIACIDGCESVLFNNGDGSWTGDFSLGQMCTNETLPETCKYMAGYHWNAWNQTCEPKEPECTANQAKDPITGMCKDACPEGMQVNQQGQCEKAKDQCPAGNVQSPEGACLPGEGQCAAGEARRENGTCGKDSDGDGKADEDDDDPNNDPDKESASGGDNCNVPPSCSGGAILCMQVKIQWRIDCNTRKQRNVSGGACAAMPVCTGDDCDAVEYSQLLMQWRTACALEKLAAGDGNGGTGNGQPDWTKVTGMSQDPGAGASQNDTKVLTSKKLGPQDLDQSGFGGGGSCIGFAQGGGQGLSAGFTAVLASPPAIWCDYISTIRYILLTFAAVGASFMLAKGVG